MSFSDPIGDRMKEKYENPYKGILPKKTNLVIRLDGKAFHTYTKKLIKPFDERLTESMKYASLKLAEHIPGCKLTYTQSDEASLWLTDYDSYVTDGWFGYDLQKIISISSSLFTAHFNAKINQLVLPQLIPNPASFDARVLVIADPVEISNYFTWRFFDAQRNAISSLGQKHYGHTRLFKKSTADIRKMLAEDGMDVSKMKNDFIHGFFHKKFKAQKTIVMKNGAEPEPQIVDYQEWRFFHIFDHKDITKEVSSLVPNPHSESEIA